MTMLDVIKLGTVAAAIVLMFLLEACEMAESCENVVLKTQNSPNSNARAILFTRTCGATTGLSFQISIDDGNSFDNKSGNLAVFVPKPGQTALSDDDIELSWMDSQRLQISYSDSKYELRSHSNSVQGTTAVFIEN